MSVAGAASEGRGGVAPEELAGLLSAFNDVTLRLQASHEKLHAEVARLTGELQAANAQIERSRRLAALGEMAAGIAHEIRNPLGSIRLYARLLEQDGRGAGVEETAGKILRAARAMEQVVGDVLSFAREVRVQEERLAAGEVFGRALEACLHDGVGGWRGVEVVRAGGGELAVACDSGLAVQACVNVVRNAIEAMVEGGVARPRLELWASREGGRVSLAVMDNGPGVSAEVVERMFNPFFTTRRAGTGLGLAIVHRIMEAHGGEVRVRNNEGVPGALVELVFRAGDATEPACEVVTTWRGGVEAGTCARS